MSYIKFEVDPVIEAKTSEYYFFRVSGYNPYTVPSGFGTIVELRGQFKLVFSPRPTEVIDSNVTLDNCALGTYEETIIDGVEVGVLPVTDILIPFESNFQAEIQEYQMRYFQDPTPDGVTISIIDYSAGLYVFGSPYEDLSIDFFPVEPPQYNIIFESDVGDNIFGQIGVLPTGCSDVGTPLDIELRIKDNENYNIEAIEGVLVISPAFPEFILGPDSQGQIVFNNDYDPVTGTISFTAEPSTGESGIFRFESTILIPSTTAPGTYQFSLDPSSSRVITPDLPDPLNIIVIEDPNVKSIELQCVTGEHRVGIFFDPTTFVFETQTLTTILKHYNSYVENTPITICGVIKYTPAPDLQLEDFIPDPVTPLIVTNYEIVGGEPGEPDIGVLTYECVTVGYEQAVENRVSFTVPSDFPSENLQADITETYIQMEIPLPPPWGPIPYTTPITPTKPFASIQVEPCESGAGCGDPHIFPIRGPRYDFGSGEYCYTLLDNHNPVDRIVVNTKCWYLPQEEFSKLQSLHSSRNINWAQKYTYNKYISCRYNNEYAIFDLDTLEIVEYTNDYDVDNFSLKASKSPKKYANLKISEIKEDNTGLYNYIIKQKRPGLALYREINIKNINIHLSSNVKDTNRNTVRIDIVGSSNGFTGAFIEKNDENQIDKLLHY